MGLCLPWGMILAVDYGVRPDAGAASFLTYLLAAWAIMGRMMIHKSAFPIIFFLLLIVPLFLLGGTMGKEES